MLSGLGAGLCQLCDVAQKIAGNDTFEYVQKRSLLTYRAGADLRLLQPGGELETIGSWSRDTGIQPLPNKTIQAARRYFRVGTTVVSTLYTVFNSRTPK